MPPPGWYPDPASEANIRYWDGQGWTDRVQPKSVPPPPVAAPPTPIAQPPYLGSPYPSAPYPGAPQPAAPQPAAPQPGAPYGYPPNAGPQPLLDPYGGYAAAPPMAAPIGRPGPDGQILSGWWRRVGGSMIDSLIVGIPAGIAWAITTMVVVGNGGTIFDAQAWDDLVARIEAGDTTIGNGDVVAIIGPGFWTALIVSGAVYLIASLFNGVYLISRSGQTLGDRAVSVRKVMAGRTVPTFATALARWLIPNVLFAGVGNFVPFGFLLTWLDYLWPLWDAKSQTLHDKMVRTYVERSDLSGPPVPRR